MFQQSALSIQISVLSESLTKHNKSVTMCTHVQLFETAMYTYSYLAPVWPQVFQINLSDSTGDNFSKVKFVIAHLGSG